VTNLGPLPCNEPGPVARNAHAPAPDECKTRRPSAARSADKGCACCRANAGACIWPSMPAGGNLVVEITLGPTNSTERPSMQLLSFSVTNYRSITSAQGVTLSRKTVLIGRNNEGKSNVLRALQTSMQLLQRHALAESRPARVLGGSDETYLWTRDFPLRLQKRPGTRQTVFRLEFGLTEDETTELKGAIGSSLKGSLPLEITIDKEQKPSFRVVKSGSGTLALAQKSTKIAKFVAERIHFSYIPAVRTDRDTLELIQRLLSTELRILEKEPKYQEALSIISDLQRPILDKLGVQVQTALQTFLPSIKSVRIEVSDSGRRYALRSDVAVMIDDGTATSIEHKGDGIKSLAALGLLRSQQVRPGASILAIEEPESHLHPEAIHQINQIIESVSLTTQVILTTHNPLFVDAHPR
jgi:putative ATP-dependent endonuclease of OLD family